MGGLGKWGLVLIPAAFALCAGSDAFAAKPHHRAAIAQHKASSSGSSNEEGGSSVEVKPVALNQIHTFEDKPAPFALLAREEFLVDAKTGTVLYSFNEHERLQPASLAK